MLLGKFARKPKQYRKERYVFGGEGGESTKKYWLKCRSIFRDHLLTDGLPVS